MITGTIKNQIDYIWDVLHAGGVVSSIHVVEQLTYLFFMKMLDDEQLKSEENVRAVKLDPYEMLDNPVFPKGEWYNESEDRNVKYEDLRWSKFCLLPEPELMDRVRNDVFPFIKQLGKDKDSAYSRFMANAVFLIENTRTLKKVVDAITQNLNMTDRDTMGDMYEYVLGKMAESGTNGQFRTPRHIIRMMVEMMKPGVEDRICDPAMGTAGFIVEAAKYIKKHHSRELMEEKYSNHYDSTMFSGFDTDTTMLRIGSMNLMLNSVTNPNVLYRDSLSKSNTDEDCYTMVLANPPFSGTLDNEVVAPSLLRFGKAKKTQLLFLSLFLRILERGGKCASIVDYGVLYGSTKAHKALRKELVDHQQLSAVISMPSGVFKPYAGVSSAILIFTKTNAASTERVWFYDMHADGYSLDDKRKEIEENDIPDIIHRFKNLDAESSRTRRDQSFLVPVQEIRDNGYSLAINKYKEVVREEVVYDAPDVIFSRIEQLQGEITEAMNEFKNKYLKG